MFLPTKRRNSGHAIARLYTGIAATEDGGPARQRLTQMPDFYNFLFEEIPTLLDRWYQRSGSAET